MNEAATYEESRMGSKLGKQMDQMLVFATVYLLVVMKLDGKLELKSVEKLVLRLVEKLELR
jgi:hypothetical protein